jgi:hypothetical protein
MRATKMPYKFIDLIGQVFILKDTGFNIINGIAIYEINDKVFARIKITNTNISYSRDYNAVHVAIVNKETGTIDGSTFTFSDYCKPDHDRTPQTNPHPYFKINERFETVVWKGTPPTEKSLTELEKEVLKYIEVFI